MPSLGATTAFLHNGVASDGRLETDRTKSESWAPDFLPRPPAGSTIISTVPALVMCLTGGSGKQLDLMFDGGKGWIECTLPV